MDQEDIANRNISQLDFAGKALGNLPRARSLPGSRADGGMATRAPDVPMGNSLIQQVVEHEKNLLRQISDLKELSQKQDDEILRQENEIIELRAKLDLETKQSEHYRSMLRKIAELVVNGAKEQA